MDSMSFPPRLERGGLTRRDFHSEESKKPTRDSCRFLHIGQGLIQTLADSPDTTAALVAIFDRQRQSGDRGREEKSVWRMAGNERTGAERDELIERADQARKLKEITGGASPAASIAKNLE
ncbi:MAG: hypothetical protein EPO61_04150 [Nitrospirae bacterium]|nr:MAG: hypothetical protein EPO61_04150 [Nitrospirota bacterium]